MTREKLLLQLLSDDVHTLHASALALEKDFRGLSQELASDDIDSLAGLIAQINCSGFAPIESLLREAGVLVPGRSVQKNTPPAISGVLAEAGASARRSANRRIGAASAISVMRRSARYMEMYCSSVADSAVRLGMKSLAEHLRAWAREWIGLELNLNAAAARSQETVRYREETVFAA